MSYGAAIDELSTAPVKKVATITVPEGYSREQAAPLAKEAGLAGSYLDASVSSKYLEPAQYGGKDAKNLEGFLFPDTFELKPGGAGRRPGPAPARRLQAADQGRGHELREEEEPDRLRRGHDRLDGRARGDGRQGAAAGRGGHLQPPQRRDAARDRRDHPLRHRQLRRPADRIGTGDRLALQHAHQRGLPPGPIDSPGLASIEAAARPAKVDYLFYVVKPGACGEHAFSSTEAEFEADVTRYNEAREAAGGESPTPARRRHGGDEEARRPRPSRRPLPLAGDAERRACRTRPGGGVELRGDRRRPGRVRATGPRLPGGASPASTSPSPTRGRRWRSPTSSPRPHARSAPPTR